MKLPVEYMQAMEMGNLLFPSLFQFENGLRLVIHNFLSECYTKDWWMLSLKTQLPYIFQYVEDQEVRKDKMPWIGKSKVMQVLPIHLVTLGQLEEIVKKYRSECIPQLFPTLEFFLGHMEVIKRVRNLYSHMFPCITRDDVRVAKREILTLCSHINTRLEPRRAIP